MRTEAELDRLRARHIGELYSLWKEGKPLPEFVAYGGLEGPSPEGDRDIHGSLIRSPEE